jgi:hypothetical protein
MKRELPRWVFERAPLTELRNASGIPQGRHCIRALRVYPRMLAIEIAFLQGLAGLLERRSSAWW